MEPTNLECLLRHTATLLIWLREKTGLKVSEHLRKQAATLYADDRSMVPELCHILRCLKPEALEEIVYDSHDPMARQLADWWETHLEADRKREEEERQEEKKKQLREIALAKLFLRDDLEI